MPFDEAHGRQRPDVALDLPRRPADGHGFAAGGSTMATAIEFQHDAAYVDGAWIAADSGRTVAVTAPATGETLGHVPDCGKAETARAIAAADKAQPAWRAKTAKERAK